VIEAAARLARRNWHNARLTILHVYKTSHLDRAPPGGGHASDLIDEARSYLEHHVRMAQRQTATVPIEGKFVVGDPTNEIVHLADTLAADMIVMSTHDSTGLERLLLGSVAEAVVRRAHCAVMVVRAKGRPPKRA
jgi:nucleotide-binding universal stress UspA family protein